MTKNENKMHSVNTKIKWKLGIEGIVSQWFGENANPLYKAGGMDGHSGIDTNIGWLSPIKSHMDAYVYKTYDKDKGTATPDGYTTVVMLTHIKDDLYMEHRVGHCYKILVSEGDWIPEGYVIAHEGNSGTVYRGDTKYEEGDPNKGTKGDHRHWQYRTVRRIPSVTNGHYLGTRSGIPYRDGAGYVYEIINKDNGYRGCIDPMKYLYKNTLMEEISMIIKNITFIKDRFNLK